MLRLTVIIFMYLVPGVSILMVVYKPAYFQPTDVKKHIVTLASVPTMDKCACQCISDQVCVTGSFFGNNETCVLFASYLSQGQVNQINNYLAGVFSFPDRINKFRSINPPERLEWLFDRNFNTIEGQYTGYLLAGSSNITETSDSLWISPGYNGFGSAVSFPPNTRYVIDQIFDFTSISFSVTAWILIPQSFNSTGSQYFILLTHCGGRIAHQCLHLVVDHGRLRLDFFSDALIGNIQLDIQQWYHVAYVYDRTASLRYVYVNGNVDRQQIPLGPYAGNASQIIVGPLPSMIQAAYQQGYIDRLLFVSHVRNDSDILNEATLVAYYKFDNSFIDSGPNHMNNISENATTFELNGRLSQALMINSSNGSYFQTNGFYYLGISNYSYSFSLWIYPFINNGTILTVSSSGNWCIPMICFDNNGSLTAQTLSINGLYKVTLHSMISLINKWTHVGVTYSSINGLHLFTNGSLVDYSNSTWKDYRANGQRYTINLGSECSSDGTKIIGSQFIGKIDELKIFSRELNSTEISHLSM